MKSATVAFLVISLTSVVSLRIQYENISDYVEFDDVGPDPAEADGLRLFDDASRDILFVHIG